MTNCKVVLCSGYPCRELARHRPRPTAFPPLALFLRRIDHRVQALGKEAHDISAPQIGKDGLHEGRLVAEAAAERAVACGASRQSPGPELTDESRGNRGVDA